MGTAFVEKSYKGLFTPGIIDFGYPLSELIGSSGIDTANSDSEHEQSLS